jgi:hypothetical protein
LSGWQNLLLGAIRSDGFEQTAVFLLTEKKYFKWQGSTLVELMQKRLFK